MSAAVILQCRNPKRKRYHTQPIWKRERGLAEPVGRALPRRGEAGGRIPSFPQTVSCPRHRSAEREWRG